MKKYLSLIVLFTIVPYLNASSDSCKCKVTSHTFFSVRPPYETATPERDSLFLHRVRAREDGHYGAVQFTVLGGQSTNGCDLARFFTPFCKTTLKVTELDTDDNDLLANQFNIYTGSFEHPGGFESTICFKPRQSVVGLGITYKQGFARCNKEEDRYLWFEISSPILRVKNTMCFSENVTETGGEPVNDDVVANMTQALNQDTWCYGKIDQCAHDKVGLADIEFKLGYEYLKCETCNLEGYIGVLIPTGNEVEGKIVFEPIVGHGKHFGFMFGSSGDFELWHNDELERRIVFAYDMNFLYLAKHKERRSFDLKYKPWSRYMQVYANLEQAQQAATAATVDEAILLHTPGINVFTRDMCINPNFSRTYNAEFIFYGKCWQAEAGYNFYARSPECVELACSWVEGPALKSLYGYGYTDNVQTINNRLNNNNAVDVTYYDENIITLCDLDLESAAHPCVLSHTIFGALGYRWDDREYPAFLGIGASYEFAVTNAGLDRWLAWGKFGFSF